MTRAVTELVVDNRGALLALSDFERGMEASGQATVSSTGALDRFNAAQAKVAEAIARGVSITTQSIERRTAEQRAMERWQSTVDKTLGLEIRLRREAERAAIDMSNAVTLGYTTPQQAVSTLTALEERHKTELMAATVAAGKLAASQGPVAAAIDRTAASMGRLSAANDNALGNTANIAAQFQDIGVTAAMGMNPIMIALQQGTQLSSVMSTMQNPVRGLASAFLSIINPVSLLTIGFVALGAAAIQWFMSAQSGAEDAEKALEAHDKWLDDILEGYESVREAAKEAGDEARRLPAAEVKLAISGDLADKQEDYAAALAQVQKQILATSTTQEALMSLMLEGGEAALVQRDALLDIQEAARLVAPNLDRLALSLKTFIENNPDSVLLDIADGMLANVEAARDAKVAMIEMEASSAAMNDSLFFGAGVEDALERIARKTVDVRTEQEKLQDQFAKDMVGVSSMADVMSLIRAYDDLNRAAKASAWAVANSGDAASVAAGQYGTAAGAAGAYANALWNLGNLIPQVAAAQGAFQQLQQAEAEYSQASAANQQMLDGRIGGLDEFIRRQDVANERYQQAQDAISGVTAAEEEMARVTQQNSIDALAGREQALARVNLQYEGQAKNITDLANKGASNAEVQALLAQNSDQLAVALGNTNTQFDQMAAKAGGAGKALKDADRDLKSFLSTADQLGEKYFPAEFAQREATELSGLLEKYRGELDAFQIAAVNKEIAALGKVEDKAGDAAKEIMETLGSALGSLFDGPMDDMDAFFDKLFSGFAQIGQQNLSSLFEGMMGGAANDNASTKKMGDTIKNATAEGSANGIFAGFDAWFGQQTGTSGQGAGAGMLSAGVGGFGMGYQAQDPLMGALGGAAQGFAVGGVPGAIIGGIAGLIGGLVGAGAAADEAAKKLEAVKGALDNLIAVGYGTGVGTFATAFGEYRDKSAEFQQLAKDADDDGKLDEIRMAYNAFVQNQRDEWDAMRGGIITSLNTGQGPDSAFLQASAGAKEMGEQLKAFVADSEFFGNATDDMRAAAQNMALSLLTGGDQLTEVERAVASIEGTASALQLTLEQLGMSSEDAAVAIQSGVITALGNLRDTVLADINGSINELSGRGYLNDINAAMGVFQGRLVDLSAVGGDTDLAFEELSLSLGKIVRDAGLTEAEILNLTTAFPALAGVIGGVVDAVNTIDVDRARSDLAAAYQKEASALEQVIDRNKALVESLKDFKTSLRIDSQFSPLSPEDKLAEAQRQFNETAGKALAGDQDAMADLTGVSQAYLDAARGYYASSEQYFAIFGSVESILDQALSKAETQVTEAEKQLEALNRQVDGLITINDSVLSVADAIRNLNFAQAANDNMGGFDPNTYWSATMKALYAEIQDFKADTGSSTVPIENFWNQLYSSTSAAMMEDIAKRLMAQVDALTPGYANGTLNHPGGMAWVGEQGRELVNLPRGSQVMPHQQSMAFAANSNGGGDNRELLAEIRALRQEVASLKAVSAAGSQAVVGAVGNVGKAIDDGNQEAKIMRRAS